MKLLIIFGLDPDFSCKMYLANLDLAGGSQAVSFPGYSLAIEIFPSRIFLEIRAVMPAVGDIR
jgi:hypothetical protein